MWIATLILTSAACANAKVPIYPINPIPPPYTPYLDSRPSFQFPGMLYYGIYLRRSAQPSTALQLEHPSILRQSRPPESPIKQPNQSIGTKRSHNKEPNPQRQHARRLAPRRKLRREGPIRRREERKKERRREDGRRQAITRKPSVKQPKPPAKPPTKARVRSTAAAPLATFYDDYDDVNPYIYEPTPCPPGMKNVLDHCAASTDDGMCPSGTVPVNDMCVATIIYPGKSNYFEEPIPW